MKNTIKKYYCYFFNLPLAFDFFFFIYQASCLTGKKIEKFPWVAFQMLRSSGLAAQHCPKPTGHTSHCYACCSLYYFPYYGVLFNLEGGGGEQYPEI